MPDKNIKGVPVHVGIILDGNRRWARERNLPTFEGHKKGFEKMRDVPQWFYKRGVRCVSVYAFSTENWNRSQDEVGYLMKIFREAIENELEKAAENGYRIVVSGIVNSLPEGLPEAIAKLEEATQFGVKGILNICLNYGGRQEIIDAVKKMMKNKIQEEQIREDMVGKYLYNGELIPDADLIIRPGGEMRLSNFLLWRAAYSELYFLKKYWPDFEESDVETILRDFAGRQRRFGGN